MTSCEAAYQGSAGSRPRLGRADVERGGRCRAGGLLRRRSGAARVPAARREPRGRVAARGSGGAPSPVTVPWRWGGKEGRAALVAAFSAPPGSDGARGRPGRRGLAVVAAGSWRREGSGGRRHYPLLGRLAPLRTCGSSTGPVTFIEWFRLEGNVTIM